MANEFKVKNGLKVGNTEIIDSNGQIDWGRLKNKVTAVAGSSNGLLSSSDKSKLDGIDSGAQVNQTITAGTGLSGGGSTDSLSINLSHLGIDGLTDPNDDRIMFWDDSAGASQWLDLGSNLSISGTTISSTNTTYSVGDGGLTQKNFTTADNTKLDGIEASADVTDTTNVVAALTAGTNVAIAADGTISSTDTNTDTWRGIQDNLTSTSTTDSLSAKQGKVLKESIDAKTSVSTPAMAASVALDFNNVNFTLNLNQNINLTATNLANNIGATGTIVLIQDTTGGRTIGTFPSEFKTPNGEAISQVTTANSVSAINYYTIDANTILVNYLGDFK